MGLGSFSRPASWPVRQVMGSMVINWSGESSGLKVWPCCMPAVGHWAGDFTTSASVSSSLKWGQASYFAVLP